MKLQHLGALVLAAISGALCRTAVELLWYHDTPDAVGCMILTIVLFFLAITATVLD